MKTMISLALLLSACAEAQAPTPAEPAHAVVPATSARHIALAGRLADGQLVTVTVGAEHAMLAIGDDVTVLDGNASIVLTGVDDESSFGWANLEINSGVRAVFGLSYHRHGDRLFLEGTGTVADQDVDVVGVLAVAPRGADVLVAVALTDDPFALVVVGAEAEIVLPEGTVGGELVPAYAVSRVVASDAVDARPGVVRELVEIGLNDQALYGAQELSNCAQ